MKTIVVGSLNTDLVATGIKQFPKSGEHVYGKELLVGAGGKSRNIADMIAHLAPKGSVAMIGRTTKDSYGLWQVPIKALAERGVNTDYIVYAETNKLPGIAFIPVDTNGNNQIFVLPGVSDDFCIEDIDAAFPLFNRVAAEQGIMVLTLECPLETATYAVKVANNHGLKVLFDPGGIEYDSNFTELVKAGIYLIKPNEHEAKVITGIEVIDFETAKIAASKLQAMGIANVLITAGANGAYLFTAETAKHLIVPELSIDSGQRDETGCGDQTMAALCIGIQAGETLEAAADLAVRAGTLQFHKIGVQPITKEELAV